jgi:hypothetical protein
MAGFLQTVRDRWLALTRRPAAETRAEVIVHDPGAQQPHDLDDPFIDSQAQSRIGDVIANNAAKKH